MQKQYKIKVDITKKYAMPAFEVNTNDLKSIRLSIEVLNGASPLDLKDKAVRIAIRKPDNHIVFQDCKITDAANGQVEVILENQAYITPGTHTAEIMCYKGSDVVAVSGTFSYKSSKGIMNDEAVESKSEFTAINRTIEEAERILEDLRENGGGVGVDEQARQGIQDVTKQLADEAKKIVSAKNESIQAVRTNGNRRCIVSFVSDDSYIEDYTILYKQIFQPHNIPVTCAVISGYAGNPDQLTDAQMKELYNAGWEFAAHTHNHPHLPTLNKQQQDDELRLSKEFLEKKGYKCDCIVYPFGEHNQDTRDVARKYFRFGFETGAKVADYPVRTYAISRVAVGAYFDGTGKDTLEYYKSKFDEAYTNNKWVIFMLHPHDQAFNTAQQQMLKDLIAYIKTFNVPFMTAGRAYEEMGNMITVGDGTSEKFIITNTGDIFSKPEYSSEVSTQTNAWQTGMGNNQTVPIPFIDEANVKLRLKANSVMTNPSIISVGKNIWGGLKAANDIIRAVNDPTIAYFQMVDGKRCVALKGSSALLKTFFVGAFIEGKQYVISGSWRRDASATGTGGSLRFKHTDGTNTSSVHPADANWANFAFGSAAGKTVSAIEGNYGSNNNIIYIDIDTIQVEIGIAKTAFEAYKESKLSITANIAENDYLTFENNKLYKNADIVPYTNNLKAYRNGTLYVSDGSKPNVYIIYPLNSKAAQDLAVSQVIAQ